MTRRALRESMDPAEFNDWIDFYAVEPFGMPRSEARHGDLMSSLWALHGGKDSPSRYRDGRRWRHEAPSPAIDEDAEVLAALGER